VQAVLRRLNNAGEALERMVVKPGFSDVIVNFFNSRWWFSLNKRHLKNVLTKLMELKTNMTMVGSLFTEKFSTRAS
jgi:hypothetical protein